MGQEIAKTDLAELRRLHGAAQLSELTSTHIVNTGYTHLANLTTAPDKPCFAVMERKEAMDWFAAIHNAFPALRDELEAAREAVSEESNRWVSVIRAIDPEALCDFHDEHGSQEYLKAWLDVRDRRMKLVGAAEEVELLIANWRNMRLEDYLPRRAAKLRQEAEEK